MPWPGAWCIRPKVKGEPGHTTASVLPSHSLQQQAKRVADTNSQGKGMAAAATTSKGNSHWPTGQGSRSSKSSENSQPNEVTSVPLGIVVEDAAKRWFEDTYRDAQRGDVKQQALLGQMLAEGYGCQQDLKAAREWTERARKKGFRMQGVYCQL